MPFEITLPLHFVIYLYNVSIMHRSAGIVIGYRLKGTGSHSWQCKSFSLLYSVETGSRAHPASYPIFMCVCVCVCGGGGVRAKW
jgi:transposase-like protein